MGRDEIGQRNSNRLFGLTSELGNGTVVAEVARGMVDMWCVAGAYIAGGTPWSSCTPQLLRANDTVW